MKRLGYLVVLMALSSSAQAGETLSFVIGGQPVVNPWAETPSIETPPVAGTK
jgi:hypothetical protein